MGRRKSPAVAHAGLSWIGRASVGLLLAFGALCAPATGGFAPAAAQSLNDRLAQQGKNGGQTDRMLVDANEMTYDRERDVVGAKGNVVIYHQGRVLNADRVTYDRKTKRVFAEGNVKITERDGTIARGEKVELTDDFKDGFIDSLRVETVDKARFEAPRAERVGGETTTYFDGSYTACEACKDDPSRPPLWRVRAKRIIHKNSEQMIYYEDAVFELYGMPIAWLPYFSTPDPTVSRKTGFLAPTYIAKTGLGGGVAVPFFWAIAPNMDLTLRPTVFTQQGFFGDVEWRHRMMTGSYTIRASGIFQADPGAFEPAPYGGGNRQMRGALETRGEFFLNTRWKYGWDATVLSDRWFFSDYRMPSTVLSQNYFRESVSNAYLIGKGERAYFDLRGIYVQGLSRADIQAQQPVVLPVLDYNKTVNLPTAKTLIGGQITVDFNFTNIARELASFEAIGGRRLDRAFSLFDVCETAAGVRTYNRTDCLVRGIGGNYARGTLNVEWKRRFIDPIGQVWTPFAFAHMNGSYLSLSDSGSKTFTNSACAIPPCTSYISNADQSTFFTNGGAAWRGQVAPGVGLDYRYPFMASDSLAWHVFEPIAQIVVRPSESINSLRVNEDAQSLVFDDSNLFSLTKFSGYDRFEGGTRVNYGAQYTATFRTGGYFNVMAGQSFQLAGRNSYANYDAANIGFGSGLDRKYSDIVTRAAFAPNAMFNLVAKGRFDPDTFAPRRIDLLANARFGSLDLGLQYARYQSQTLIGYDVRREGLMANAKVRMTKNVSLNGSVIFDLSRHLYNDLYPSLVTRAPLFSVAGLGVGAVYSDECTTIALNYTSILQNTGVGPAVRNQTVLLSVQLRSVGDTSPTREPLFDRRMLDGFGVAADR